jgi:hypothetical protein
MLRRLGLACLLACLLGCLAMLVTAWDPRSAPLAHDVLLRFSQLRLFDGEESEPQRPARALDVATSAAAVRVRASPRAKPKRRLTQLMKKKVAARDRWRCQICDRLLSHTYEIDHIVPLHLGGSDVDTNLRALCRECHGVQSAEQVLQA